MQLNEHGHFVRDVSKHVRVLQRELRFDSELELRMYMELPPTKRVGKTNWDDSWDTFYSTYNKHHHIQTLMLNGFGPKDAEDSWECYLSHFCEVWRKKYGSEQDKASNVHAGSQSTDN